MLSFVTVTFNNLRGLKSTYNSILKCIDDIEKFEWIVIDGGSHDGTIDFLSDLTTSQIQLKWVSEKDNGIYDAMNKGVRLCHGDYVHFLNAGDKLINDKVINFVSEKDGSDVYYFAVNYNYNGHSYIRKPKNISYSNYGMPANHQGCVYKKEILLANPYPSKYRVSADYWLNCICYRNNVSCSYYVDPIVDFEVGGVSTTKFIRVVKDMYCVQRDVLKMNIIKATVFAIRRFVVMTINYLLYKASTAIS